MEDNIYHIPSNYTDAGRLFGAFEIRNAVETVILTLPALFACLYLLPLALTPKIIATMTVIVLRPAGYPGRQSWPVAGRLGGWLRFRKQRRRISFRGEVRG